MKKHNLILLLVPLFLVGCVTNNGKNSNSNNNSSGGGNSSGEGSIEPVSNIENKEE